MSLLLSYPFLNSYGTKDKIIYILSREWPLSTKEIHNQLKKQYSVNVTYQAVHKLVKQFLDQEIIEVKERKYLLNLKWIQQTKKFLENSMTNYANGTNEKRFIDLNFDTENIKYLDFEYLSDLKELFWKIEADQRRKIIDLPQKDRIICINLQHCIAALANPENEYEYMNILKKIGAKQYTLVRGDTLLDKYVKKFYDSHESKAVNLKLGVNDLASVSEQWIFPSILVELYFSTEFLQVLEDIYSSVKEIHDIDLNRIFKQLRDQKYTMKAVIQKNPSVIRAAREKTLNYFFNKSNLKITSDS